MICEFAPDTFSASVHKYAVDVGYPIPKHIYPNSRLPDLSLKYAFSDLRVDDNIFGILSICN